MMFTPGTLTLAEAVLNAARARGVLVAAAESCTGGLVMGALTAIPGSSDVVDRGFVTYSNTAKAQALDVPTATLRAHGAVSGPVAEAMALGALARSQAGACVAITGVAGPGGGSAEKPVGTVWFATAVTRGATRAVRRHFPDLDRDGVRAASVDEALRLLRDALG